MDGNDASASTSSGRKNNVDIDIEFEVNVIPKEGGSDGGTTPVNPECPDPEPQEPMNCAVNTVHTWNSAAMECTAESTTTCDGKTFSPVTVTAT